MLSAPPISAQQIVVKWMEFAAAGAILLALGRLAVRRLRQPADRITLIRMTLLTASLVPLLLAVLNSPAWHLGIVSAHRASTTDSRVSLSASVTLPSASRTAAEDQRVELSRTVAASAGPELGSVSSAHATAPLSRFDFWELAALALVVIHGLAATGLLAEWIYGLTCLRGMSARARPAGKTVTDLWMLVTKNCGAPVRLLVSREVSTPLTYGCRRPTVLVPEAIASGDAATLRFCLAHEWSHIENGDSRGWQVACLCQFLLWFQPLFWKLRRELRVCQDFLADNHAAGDGRDAIEYSELLMAFARQRLCRPIAGAIPLVDRSSQLSRRIKMLLASPTALRPRSPLAFYLAAGVLSLVGATLVGAVRLDSARADDEAQPTASQDDHAEPSKEQPAAPKTNNAETLHYTCVVLDKDTGKGIPDATVVVRRSKLTSEENTIVAETRHKTDAEGKYSFEIPPEQVAIPLLYIELDVDHDNYAAQKGFGYGLTMIRKNEKLGERPFFETVELRPSEPITGTVVAPDGKPLSGVKVQGYSKASASDFRDYGSFTESITNDSGKFRLNLVKGGVGVFWVLPTHYASTSRDVNKERGDVGEIRLRPGVRVSGRVLSAEGKPVAKIPVNIQYEGGGNETVNNLPVATSIRRSAITDEDGHFAFDPLPNGDYRVIPEEHHYDPIVRDRARYEIPGVFLPMKVKIQEGVASAPIEIQASPHVLLNAQILDSKGNKTRGHEVHVFGQMDGQYWFGQGRPNQEGTISMRIPHGLQEVQLNLSTNEHGALRFRRSKGKELENIRSRVELGTLNDDVDGLEIIRYRAPLVLINAVDAEGKQLKDFHVTAAYSWGKQEYVLAGELRSDLSFEHQNDGRYRTSQMLPDEDVKFTVTAPGYEATNETVRLPEGETKDLVVTLKKAAESKTE
ncbi:MAG TPA: M56 family metallopeptidase [Pirellulales bacterium]|nr:M56 family metallopeptidase [Pirellulales bacterium]